MLNAEWAAPPSRWGGIVYCQFVILPNLHQWPAPLSHQLVRSMFDLVRPLVLSLISYILLRHEETNSPHRVFQQGTLANTKSVAIVGAGSAGLAMLKALLDLPEELGGGWEIVLYEQRRDIGGIWYDSSRASNNL
jgi:hypothetical protein